ncbi:DUF2852 domain-containing protein [Phreatobacter cathodiphilus]|uniref:DUF2852 domain-containing protein n=1 Tax=Phreatobacter cathodiphilus TaxID=1868589 RepID=A0A2S0NCA1_9HYPH|nr:DUF2852 domain-containing protein [Phreatobacter cathodiphilus]AVO45563.1 hypothetical protein C6569_11070 [Phreatobacter cathodiphilus]
MTCLNQTSPRLPAFHGGWRGAAERRWHPVELAAMIVGFVLFWPIGLAILAWKKWMGNAPRGRGRGRDGMHALAGPADTGNVAFEDYKRQELERLEAERRRLFEAQDEFAAYLERLKRSRDRAEFDQFMAERAATPRPPAA